MPIFHRNQLGFIRAVAELNYTNPFLQKRIDLERTALGRSFVAESIPYWSFDPLRTDRRSNLVQLTRRSEQIAQQSRAKLLAGKEANQEELQLYDDLVLYLLFNELLVYWDGSARSSAEQIEVDLRAWQHYSDRFDLFMKLPQIQMPSRDEKFHLFAIFRQIFRAFFNIFDCVIGRSLPAAKLRAQIWQSIFTHDLRRYRRSLFRTMAQVTTLVTGPSGSGKDLVAKAIGTARYVPFDSRSRKFISSPNEHYYAINVSAFSTNLIESELFGHAKGAFTDASNVRVGWLETCGEFGSLLLDEIGEMDPRTQVKLLRVLQNREYQRLGETKVRAFEGKIIAATNRDLRKDIEAGRFREDLFYRLCADVIETPSLAEQLADSPEVLESLIVYIARRIAPEEHAFLSVEVLQWIRGHLPSDYQWPGNIRELEQCVRNIMIHSHYAHANRPLSSTSTVPTTMTVSPAAAELGVLIDSLSLTADELLRRYCQIAYGRTKSFERAASILQLDRRTVRAKV